MSRSVDLSITREHLHSLRSSSHADKLDVAEHFLQVVRAGAQGEMVENILSQLLDVRVHQLHLLASLAPDNRKYFTKNLKPKYLGTKGPIQSPLKKLTFSSNHPGMSDHWFSR